MNLLDTLIKQRKERIKQDQERTKKKFELLADPSKVDKLVAAHVAAVSPSTKKPKDSEFSTKVAALESVIDKDSPMKNYGTVMQQELMKALGDPAYKGMSVEQITYGISRSLLEQRDESGHSLIERAHAHKYREDNKITNFFGIFGGDEDTRALPGYDEFVESERGKEITAHYTSPLTSLLLGGGTQAGMSAALAAGKSMLARHGIRAAATAAAASVSAPAVATAAALAVPGFLAYDVVSNLIDRTDFGRSHEGTLRKEAVKLIAGGVVVPGAAWSASKKALTKVIEKELISTNAINALRTGVPTAQKVIDVAVARRNAKIHMRRFDQIHDEALIMNETFDDLLRRRRQLGRNTPSSDAAFKDVVDERGLVAQVGSTLMRGGSRNSTVPRAAGTESISGPRIPYARRAAIARNQFVLNELNFGSKVVGYSNEARGPRSFTPRRAFKSMDAEDKKIVLSRTDKHTPEEAAALTVVDRAETVAQQKRNSYYADIVRGKATAGQKVTLSDKYRAMLEHEGWGHADIEELNYNTLKRRANMIKRGRRTAREQKAAAELDKRIAAEKSQIDSAEEAIKPKSEGPTDSVREKLIAHADNPILAKQVQDMDEKIDAVYVRELKKAAKKKGSKLTDDEKIQVMNQTQKSDEVQALYAESSQSLEDLIDAMPTLEGRELAGVSSVADLPINVREAGALSPRPLPRKKATPITYSKIDVEDTLYAIEKEGVENADDIIHETFGGTGLAAFKQAQKQGKSVEEATAFAADVMNEISNSQRRTLEKAERMFTTKGVEDAVPDVVKVKKKVKKAEAAPKQLSAAEEVANAKALEAKLLEKQKASGAAKSGAADAVDLESANGLLKADEILSASGFSPVYKDTVGGRTYFDLGTDTVSFTSKTTETELRAEANRVKGMAAKRSAGREEAKRALVEDHGVPKRKVEDDLDMIDETVREAKYEKGGLRPLNFDDDLWKAIAIGAVAVPAGLLLGGSEAEASPIGDVAKVLVDHGPKLLGKSTKEGLMAGIQKARYVVSPVAKGQKKIGVLQEQLNLAGDIKAAFKKFSDVFRRTENLPFGLGRIATPYGYGEMYYKQGFNPAVQLAHMENTIGNNIDHVTQVVANIMQDVPGLGNTQRAARDVARAFSPLAKSHAGSVVAFSSIDAKLVSQKQGLERLMSTLRKTKGEEHIAKLKKSRDIFQKRIKVLEDAKAELQPKYDEYISEWEKVAKQVAAKYPSARIALAAEDTAELTRYPWLAKMMTREEHYATTHIREVFDNYQARIQAVGHRTIENQPYVHHAWHPDWDASSGLDVLKNLSIDVAEVIPFTRFHKRAQFSRQMVPEINYVMARYVPDAERRIQWSKFWDRKGGQGWYNHMKHPFVQNNPALRDYWQRILDSSKPTPATGINTWANRYSALETFALLGFSPSVAFKHFFKNIGTWGTLGFKESMSHVHGAIDLAFNSYRNSANGRRFFSHLGWDSRTAKKGMNDLHKAFTHQYRMLNMLTDLEMQPQSAGGGFWNSFDSALQRANETGSIFVRGVEAFDRAHSFSAAFDMAAKKGMTAKQASYGIMDTILKNNFLGGNLNPAWMRDPKVRALFLFQNTPFKLLERRLVTGTKGLSDLGKMGKLLTEDIKKHGIGAVTDYMRMLRKDVKLGEDRFKQYLITDFLQNGIQRDFFGTPYSKQFMREFLYAGAVIGGLGSVLEADFHGHVGHVPFLKSHSYYRGAPSDPTLAVSPMASAAYKMLSGKLEMPWSENSEFSMVDFLGQWIGTPSAIPLTARKALRLSEDDIPDIYKDSTWKYLFAVPAKE